MFQVCFTAGFPEEGKGSREGYSIYYYARAGARASGPCKKKIRKGEKISRKHENHCRMEGKKSEKTPREKEKWFIRKGNSC